MKNVFFLMIAVALLTGAGSFAQAQGGIQCLDSAGYSGNIQANKVTGNQIQIIAAQGFAYEISQQLGAKQGHEASQLTMLFNSSQCQFQMGGIRCQGPVKVEATFFHPGHISFNGVVAFHILKSRGEYAANLAIQMANGQKIGMASHRFTEPLGHCSGM